MEICIEESFNISLEDFYLEFDAFMLQDRDSQLSIIKSSDAWKTLHGIRNNI